MSSVKAEALIRKLKDETAAAGSRLLLFYIPDRREVYTQSFRVSEGRHRTRDNVGVVARRNQIPWIDPVEAFRALAARLAAKEEYLYYRKDKHWNAAGHHLVGALLASHLRENCSRYELCDLLRP